DQILRALEQRRLRLVDGHPGDALERRELLPSRLLVLFLELAQMRLSVGQTLLAPHELCQLLVDLLLLREDTLLDLDNPRAVLCNLVVDLRAELDRLFTRADLGLASKVLDFAPSL